MAEKPTPKTQAEISSQFVIDRALPGVQKPPLVTDEKNRGSTRTRKEDRTGDIKIGLYDIDDAIKYYFDEVIRPRVNDLMRMFLFQFYMVLQKDGCQHKEDNTTETKKVR